MRTLIAFMFGCFAASAMAEAPVSLQFSGSPVDSFPGVEGEGWSGPWELRGYPSSNGNKPGAAIENALDASWRGGSLAIMPSAMENSTGLLVSRSYGPLAGVVTISFKLRVNDLGKFMATPGNMFFLGESRSNSANTTRATSWAMAAGPEDASASTDRRSLKQKEWNVFDGAADARAYLPSGVPLQSDTTYAFEVTVDEAQNAYSVTIKGAGATYESPSLGFYSEAPEIKTLNFGQTYTPGTAASFSIGDVSIQSK